MSLKAILFLKIYQIVGLSSEMIYYLISVFLVTYTFNLMFNFTDSKSKYVCAIGTMPDTKPDIIQTYFFHYLNLLHCLKIQNDSVSKNKYSLPCCVCCCMLWLGLILQLHFLGPSFHSNTDS